MPPKKIFKSLKFAISGKLSQPKKDYEELITKHGGEVAGSVTSAVNFLVSNEADVKAASQKVAAALKKEIPVIQEGFVGACIASKKLLDPNFFAVKGAKKRRATSKGAAKAAPAKRSKAGPVETSTDFSVIAKSGLAEKAAIVVETMKKSFGEARLAWDVEMVLNDPSKAKDRFYNLQLCKSNTGDEFWVVQNWGRTGLEGAVNVVGPNDDVNSAKRLFRSTYRQKTGNVWGQIGTFVEAPGKYKLLAKASKSEAQAQGLWQYYLHNEVDGKKIGWYNYTGESATNMEKFWHQFEGNAGLEVRFVQSDYFKYEVNFSTMVQTNLKSGMRRVIRRVAPGKKPSPEAPSVIPEKAKPAAPAAESSEDEEEEDVEDDEEAGEGDEEEEPDEAAAEEEEAAEGEAEAGEDAEAAEDAPEAEAETIPALDEEMGVGESAADPAVKPTGRGAPAASAPTAVTARAAAASAPAEAADDAEEEEAKPAGGRAAAAAAPAGRAAPAASTGRAAPSTEAADDADTEEDTTLPLEGAKKRGS